MLTIWSILYRILSNSAYHATFCSVHCNALLHIIVFIRSLR